MRTPLALLTPLFPHEQPHTFAQHKRGGILFSLLAMILAASCSSPTQEATSPQASQAKRARSSALAYEHLSDWTRLDRQTLTSDPLFANRGVAITIVGDTAVVGELGSVEIYKWEPTMKRWVNTQTLTEPGGVADRFGAAVALDGDTLAIGAPDYEKNQGFAIGRVSIYYWNTTESEWEFHKSITSPNPSSERDVGFGTALALTGDVLAIGAPGYDQASGAVFVHTRDEDGPDNWGSYITRSPPIKRDNAYFGASLATNGNLLVVGEPAGASPTNNRTGSVTVHEGPPLWGRVMGAAPLYLDPNDSTQAMVGASVALAGDTIVVGAPNAIDSTMQQSGGVAVYRYAQGSGVSLLDNLESPNSEQGQRFGAKVSIDPITHTIVVAAPETANPTTRGKVYRAEETAQNSGSWSISGEFDTSNPNAGYFGSDLAISNNRLLVGAAPPVRADLRTGSLYEYTKDAMWSEASITQGNEPTLENVRQGSAVTIDGDTLAVSSMPEAPSIIPPSVSIYERSQTNPTEWARTRKILESRYSGTLYGKQIALSGDYLFVSVPENSIEQLVIYKRIGNMWEEAADALPWTQDADPLGEAMVAGAGWLAISHRKPQEPSSFDIYVYDEATDKWEVGPTPSPQLAMPLSESFGTDLAARGPHLAAYDAGTGRALVFTLMAGASGWQSTEIILDTDGGTLTPVDIAINEDTVAIAMVRDNTAGEVHLYDHIGYSAGDAPSITSSNPLFVGEGSIALSDNALFVAEQVISGFTRPAGQIRVFYRSENGWADRAAIRPTTERPGYKFGTNLAAQNSELLVGSPNDSSYGPNAGLSTIIHAGLGCDNQDVFCANDYTCDMTEAIPRCEQRNKCGNGLEEVGEDCDDGNIVSGDGCEVDCTFPAMPECLEDAACGNGEICFMSTCVKAEECGNGIEEAGEDCDDGNTEDGDACPANCQQTEPLVELELTLASPKDQQNIRLGEAMEVRGTATAGAYILFYVDIATNNNSYVGETYADATGTYSYVIEADKLAEFELGTHEFKVIAELDGAQDVETEVTFHILPDRGIQVGDKDVSEDGNEVSPGDVLSGYTTPGKDVIVELDGKEICRVTANEEGYWECELPTNISSGDVVVKDEDGNILGQFSISVVSGGERERERADGTRSCGGCSSSGAPPTSPLLLLFAFLFSRVFRRMRRGKRSSVSGAAVMALVAVGCSPAAPEPGERAEESVITKTQAVISSTQTSWDETFIEVSEVYPRLGFRNFGKSVAISGNTMAASTDRGVRIFERASLMDDWVETQQLYYVTSEQEQFGFSLALSEDVLVVGAPNATLGKAVVYERSAENPKHWVETASLEASANRFGHAVAARGDRILVGSPGGDDASTWVGKAYLYEKDAAGVWRNEQILEGGVPGNKFGAAVAMTDTWIACGAYLQPSDTLLTKTGKVYLYSFDGTDWSLDKSIEPTMHAASDDAFGHKVALSDDTLLVSAPSTDHPTPDAGQVYAYQNTGMGWQTEQLLDIHSVMPSINATIDGYGLSLVFDAQNNLAYVGGQDTVIPQNDLKRGAVFVWSRDANHVWEYKNALSFGMADNASVGADVAVDNGSLLAGAPTHQDMFDDSSGEGVVVSWEIDANGVQTKERAVGSIIARVDQSHGRAVALDGDLLAIGSPSIGFNFDAFGEVSIYRRLQSDPGAWRREATFVSDSNRVKFGAALAWVGGVLLVAEAGDSSSPSPRMYTIEPDRANPGKWNDPSSFGGLGNDVSQSSGLAAHGNRVLIGDTLDPTKNVIVFYEYDETQDRMNHLTDLTNTTGLTGTGFANRVAFDGKTVVTSIKTGSNQSSVLLFEYDEVTGGWSFLQRITDPLMPADGRFGTAFDIDGDFLAISSTNAPDTQSVHIYKRDSANGEFDLISSVRDPFGGHIDDGFGQEVVLDNLTLFVSAPGRGLATGENGGRVFLFQPRDLETLDDWDEVHALSPPFTPDLQPERRSVEGKFGHAIAAQSGELVVGMPHDNVYGSGNGAAFIFRAGFDCAEVGACDGNFVCDVTEQPSRCEPKQVCGNSVNDVREESCDDGNTIAGDGCSPDCLIEAGTAGCLSDNECATGVCNMNTCANALECGNGRTEENEGCDDGNLEPGDGCDASCAREDGVNCIEDADCASGICNALDGPPRCAAVSTCGNGVQETGEDCDDGNTRSGDSCSQDCKVNEEPVLKLAITSPAPNSKVRPGQLLTIEGDASAGARVTLVFQNIPQGNMTVSAAERFSFDFTVPRDNPTDMITLEVFAAAPSLDRVEDTITLTIDTRGIKLGDEDVDENSINEASPGDVLSGYTTPGKDVFVELDGKEICRVTAGSDGYWECKLPTNISSGDVVVRDEDGNILGQFSISVVSGGERERERADGTRSCGGCSSSGAPPTSPLLLLFAFLFSRVFRRSRVHLRKMPRAVAALGMTLLIVGCSNPTEEHGEPEQRTQQDALLYDGLPDWKFSKRRLFTSPSLGHETSPDLTPDRGMSAAIDGDTAAIGAVGAVEIYKWQPATKKWDIVQTISELGGVEDRFGASVALDGDTLVVGAPAYTNKDDQAFGRISIYDRDASTGRYTFLKSIEGPSTTFTDETEFGASVAVSGDKIAVGAPAHKGNMTRQAGLVLTYGQDVGGEDNWGQIGAPLLDATVTSIPELYGAAVALSPQGLLAIGAPGALDDATMTNSGAIYLYEFDNANNTWERATGQSVARAGTMESARFGSSIAIANNLIVVGAPNATNGATTGAGKVSVFRYMQGTGLAPLNLANVQPSGVEMGQQFGAKVGIDPATSRIIVTSPGLSTAGNIRGVVHIFDETAAGSNTWSLAQDLAIQESVVSQFASAATIDNDRILAGGLTGTTRGERTGSLLGYHRDMGAWVEDTRVLGGEPTLANTHLGSAVAIDGDTLAITTKPDSGSPWPPALSIYERDSAEPSKWTRKIKILENASYSGSTYGSQVALLDNYIFVSVPDSANSEIIAYRRDDQGNWARANNKINPFQRGGNLGAAMALGEDGWLALSREEGNKQRIDVFIHQTTMDNWQQGTSPAQPAGLAAESSFGKQLVTSGPYLATYDDIGKRVIVYTWQSGGWSLKEIDVDPINSGVEPLSIAIHENTLAIAVREPPNPPEVHIYDHVNYNAGQTPRVITNLSVIQTPTLAMAKDTLYVGAPDTLEFQEHPGGLIQIFQREGNTWTKRQTLYPPIERAGYKFGTNLAAQNSELLVGAPTDSSYGIGAGLGLLYQAGLGCDAENACSILHVCDDTESTPRCEEANVCGNGTQEQGEMCDDGNTLNGDDCRADCTLPPIMTCNTDADCDSGDICNTKGECVTAGECGNSRQEQDEKCDDGNTVPGDGCDEFCFQEIGYGCTEDDECASMICNTLEANPRCAAANTCGNGKQEPGEDCDDGNTSDGDACTLDCKLALEFTLELDSPMNGQSFRKSDGVRVSGTTSSNAALTYHIDGDFRGDGTPDASGVFSFDLSLDEGTYELLVSAKLASGDGELEETATRTIHILPDRGIQVGDKDVSEDGNEVSPGDVLSGYTTPGKDVIVELDGKEICRVTAGSDGYWECKLPTNISSGDVVVRDEDGNILGQFSISVVSGGERERERADGTRSCGGCSSSGAPPTSPLLLLLAFLGVRARRFGQRKWRRRVASHDA